MTREFESVFQWGGTPRAVCGCGRTHFTASGDFMDPGELESLLAKAKDQPDRYVADYENDSVSIAQVMGRTVVWSCPCKFAERIEAFIWDNRDEILSYYRVRTEAAAKAAADTAALISQVPTQNSKPKTQNHE